ncbi:hypothetical protein ACI6Q2_15715 [Chitinophagaceae bacterium LWZ2-11]
MVQLAIVNETGSLNHFYAFAATLSNNKHVRFIEKNDEGENIDWHFKYKRQKMLLQFNVYNGVSIFSPDDKKIESAEKIAIRLKGDFETSISTGFKSPDQSK